MIFNNKRIYWSYTMLTAQGQEVSAVVAGYRRDILEDITRSGGWLVEIRPDYLKTMGVCVAPRMSPLSISVFFEDLANLLDSGMSVAQAVRLLKEDHGMRGYLARFCVQIESGLKEGLSMAASLKATGIMPGIVHAAVASGEGVGKLSESCRMLGVYFKRQHHFKDKVRKALIYPCIVFVLLIAVMIFVSIKVIPQIRNLLPSEALNNQVTIAFLMVSGCIQHYGWLIFSVVFFFLGGALYLRYKDPVVFQGYVYRLPLVGRVLKESALSLYFSYLSILLNSGVPLLRAIHDLNETHSSIVTRKFMSIRGHMLGGFSFAQAIEEHDFFPSSIAVTIRRAEEAVRLEEYTLMVAEHFSRRVDLHMEHLIQLIQPALLLLGGGLLLVIALAFLMPIYGSLSTIASG